MPYKDREKQKAYQRAYMRERRKHAPRLTKDLIQKTEGNLKIPEIRVWCHPHRIGLSEDDYYYRFTSFQEALTFIQQHPEAENQPLIAFRGYEINIVTIKEAETK